MRITIFSLISICTLLAIQGAEQPLALSISLPRSENGQRILDQHRMSYFYVILSNVSDKPQKIWAPWTEMARPALTLEITSAGREPLQIQRKEWPSVSRWRQDLCLLQPHESLVMEIDFSNTNVWMNFPNPTDRLPTVSMQALFQIQPDVGAQAQGVWAGKIASEPITVTILPWEPAKGR